MADQRSRLTMDILARVAGVQDVDRLARSVDDVGDEMQGAAGDAALLDRAVDQLEDEIAELNRELLRTGDIDVFERIRRDRSALSMLQRMRREIGGIRKETGGLDREIGDTLGRIPSRLRGGLIVGVAGAAAILSPFLGGVVAGAVLGGVGAGGIVGGIASAARDARVKAAAAAVVDQVSQPFDEIGKSFIGPLVDSLDELGQAGRGVLGSLAPEIQALAPDVRLLAGGLADMAREAVPGIKDALREAGPVLRSIAAELPELGAAFGDMLSAISEGSDGAITAIRGLLNTIEVLVQGTGQAIRFLSDTFEALVDVQGAVGLFGSMLFGQIPVVGDYFGQIHENAAAMKSGLSEAADVGEDATGRISEGFRGLRDEATNQILQRHKDILRAQTDPLFALLDAQEQNRDAQQAYNEAVDEFGANSPQAQAALRDQAQAALGLQGAVADAAGAWDGEFTPAQEAALTAAGFTKEELKRLEGQVDNSTEALERFAKDYFATVTTTFKNIGAPLAGAPVLSQAAFFQHGGMVSGPAGIDRVPAMLTSGEFVVRREQAQRHLDLLRAINSGGAGGGVQPAVPAAPVRGSDGAVQVRVFIGERELLDIHKEVHREALQTDHSFRRDAGVG